MFRGTSGTLRASYTGDPIAIDGPSLLRFFNTAAFVLPPTGQCKPFQDVLVELDDLTLRDWAAGHGLADR